jgi:hypothetical protein
MSTKSFFQEHNTKILNLFIFLIIVGLIIFIIGFIRSIYSKSSDNKNITTNRRIMYSGAGIFSFSIIAIQLMT